MKNRNDPEGRDRKPEEAGQGPPEEPGSATGMFQQASPSPAESSVDEFSVRDLMRDLGGGSAREPGVRPTKLPAPPASPSLTPAQEKASSGEFTRGEFTQFFRGIAPPPAPPATDGPVPARTPSPLPSANEDAAGDFTRIFMRLPKAEEAPPAMAAPEKTQRPEQTHPPGNTQEPEPGEFTRLMRSVGLAGDAPKKRETPAADPMDSNASNDRGNPASGAPKRGFSAPGVNDAVSGTAGVTGLFAATGKPAADFSAPSPLGPADKAAPAQERGGSSDRSPGPFFRSLERSEDLQMGGERPAPREQSGGGFTQLFRSLEERAPGEHALEESEASPRAKVPLNAEPPAAAPVRQEVRQQVRQQAGQPFPGEARPGQALEAGPGEFTRLMQSLSGESSGEGAAKAPPAAPFPGIPPASAASSESVASPSGGTSSGSRSSGPGDFTRIVSSSMLREAASAAKPVSGAPAGAGAPMTPPAPLPIPAVPIPRAPSFAFGAQGAHPPAAGAAPAAAAPQPPASPPPPQSKLQAYLPVLLIINAFVLAVLILLVLFALRHH